MLQYLECIFFCDDHVYVDGLFGCFTSFRTKLHNVVPVEFVMSDSVIACIYSLHLLRKDKILGLVYCFANSSIRNLSFFCVAGIHVLL